MRTRPRRRARWSPLALFALATALLATGCSSSPSQPSAQSSSTTVPTSTKNAPPPGPTTSTTPTTQLPATTGSGAALGVSTHTLKTLIRQTGRTPAIIDTFVLWQRPSGDAIPFPSGFVDHVASLGAVPMVTWQPNQGRLSDALSGASTEQSSSDLEGIIDGSHDAFIRQWAQEAKANGHTIYLRLMHEMNADWYPWGYGVNGQTPAQYVAAFQHVVDIFNQVGATNVQFVWCVASQATVKPGAPPIASFFPGDAYVSWVAMDGYNHNPNHPKTFSEIFASDYATLSQISSRPIMIAEFGTVEIATNPDAKAQWITDAFLTEIPRDFPRVKAVLYFDLRGHGYTYPLDSDPASLAAYQKIVHDPYYQMPAPQNTLSF